MINAGAYVALQAACDRFPTAQMRSVAKAFRFVVPGHVLTSLWLLGLKATELFGETPAASAARREARVFENLLPTVAAAFVFLAIPKQMKNYLVMGLLFLAVGVIRLQQNWLKDRGEWPIVLLIAGLAAMLAAAHYPALRMSVLRRFRR